MGDKSWLQLDQFSKQQVQIQLLHPCGQTVSQPVIDRSYSWRIHSEPCWGSNSQSIFCKSLSKCMQTKPLTISPFKLHRHSKVCDQSTSWLLRPWIWEQFNQNLPLSHLHLTSWQEWESKTKHILDLFIYLKRSSISRHEVCIRSNICLCHLPPQTGRWFKRPISRL